MAKIFLFRHGETTDNQRHRFSGWSNPDLTETGIKEAKGIGEKLKHEIVTKAYCSDLLRSKHTLDLVLAVNQNPKPLITVDPRIKERDYGDLTGQSKLEIAQKYPKEYPLWHRSYDVPPPNGESIKAVEQRVLPFLRDLIKDLKPKDVIFISAHGNSLRPMRKYFEHLTNAQMCSFEHIPGKIYEYTV